MPNRIRLRRVLHGATYPFQAESLALFARMTTQPSRTRKIVIDDLIKGMKNASYFNLHNCLWGIAAHTEQAGYLNWIENDNNMTAVNAGTFTTDQGITGNGTTQYWTTGFIPSTDGGSKYSQSDAFVCVYIRTNQAETAHAIGAGGAAVLHGVSIAPRLVGDTSIIRLNNATLGYTASITDARGFWMILRTAAGQFTYYKNGVLVDTEVVASTGLTNREFYISAFNNNGTAGSFHTGQVAYAAVGKADSIDPATYYTLVQNYMTAIGANV